MKRANGVQKFIWLVHKLLSEYLIHVIEFVGYYVTCDNYILFFTNLFWLKSFVN